MFTRGCGEFDLKKKPTLDVGVLTALVTYCSLTVFCSALKRAGQGRKPVVASHPRDNSVSEL